MNTLDRYARQLLLPEIGEEGQCRLSKAKVLIVGVGGLGSPIAIYLAGAGVGTLGLVDDDVVSVSNLHRQVLYDEASVGQSKALCAKERLLAWFFGGMPEADFNRLCNDFAQARQDLIRPQAIDMIRTLNAKGQQTVIVSASAENWVSKMAELAFGAETTVTGTRLEVSNGKITGHIDGANCYGAEKARRIQEYLDSHDISREQCLITAYGDSRGDKEMTDYADKSYYKPFGD